VITSAQKRVDVSVFTIIDLTEKGKFSNNLPKFDLTNDGVTYSPVSTAVPADAKATADAYATQIKSGSLVVPEDIPNPNTP